MPKKPTRKFSFLGGLFVATLGAAILVFVSFTQGPDLNLQLLRNVPSALSPARLDRNMSSITRWPQWFYSLKEVIPQNPNQELQKGSILTLKIDPKKGIHKRFELLAEVTEFSPGKSLGLKILKDSSGRLNHLFDSVEWKVELEPKGDGTLIRGLVTAHTSHWRSRLFGRMAEKIVMNQIFYPNLLKLAELKQPFSVDQPSENLPSASISD